MKRKRKKGKAIIPYNKAVANKHTEEFLKKAILQARKLEIDIEKSYERAEEFLRSSRSMLSETSYLDSNKLVYLEDAYDTALALFNNDEPNVDLETKYKANDRNKNMVKLIRDSIVAVMHYYDRESQVLGIYDTDEVSDIFEAFQCVVHNACSEEDVELGLCFFDKMIENLQHVLQAEKWRT